MNTALRIEELEEKVSELVHQRSRRGRRSRWAAIGAAVAVTLGGGTALHFASAAPGDVVTTSFVPISPVRILDTRPAPLNVGGFVGPLSSGQTHTIQVTGVAGVPVNATAVVMNVTVDGTTASSFLTVYPAGAARPVVSNLNWAAGVTIPNLVTVKIGAAGQVSFYNLTGNTDVIADVAGYYVPGNDKFISLDVLGAGAGSTNPATFGTGFGPNAGLHFADVSNTEGSFHFVLPPDYTPGTDLVGTFTWHTTGTSCGVQWRASYTSVSRVGLTHFLDGSASSGMSEPGVGTAPGTANVVTSSTFTLNTPNPSITLQPGDSYTFGIFRSGAAVTDTCTSIAVIDSVVLRYE